MQPPLKFWDGGCQDQPICKDLSQLTCHKLANWTFSSISVRENSLKCVAITKSGTIGVPSTQKALASYWRKIIQSCNLIQVS